MKNKIRFIILSIVFTTVVNAQTNYDNLWTQVEKFELQNLPKSALKIVDKIYVKATSEKNDEQIVKSLFYKSKFALTLEENAQLKIINDFKKEIKKSSFPTKNVLENVLANLYWQYFNQNRYQFYNRTKLESKKSTTDFRTWDLETLFREIHLHFKASLQNDEKLQNINIGKFSEILQLEKDAKIYSPTLFDFLANNALDFYKTSENSITKPSYKFEIDDIKFIKTYEEFSKLKITSKDSISLQLNALKTYQKLIDFHQKKNNKSALAVIDIARLKFVKNNVIFNQKDSLFLNSLKISQQKHANHKSESLYAFEIAQLYYFDALSNQKNLNKDETPKNKQALEICNTMLKKYPKSLGAKKCFILKNQIKQQSLNIRAEKYIPIQAISKVLVSYKNIDSIYFTAYEVSTNQLEVFQKTYNPNKKITFLKGLKKEKEWQKKLTNKYDYLAHTTEVITPKFKNGMYIIVATNKLGLKENQLFGTAVIQATNLTLVQNTFINKYNYQIVDRINGKPIKNADIHLNNKGRTKGVLINKILCTDRKGFASFKSRKYYQNVSIEVTTKNDTAFFGSQYFYEQGTEGDVDEENEEIIIKPFIFTDRSIYRPGQTVYFKTIFIQKNNNTTQPFKDKYIKVELLDVNDQVVGDVDVKLNDFGSASGEFIIPNNSLTGLFSISFNESDKKNSSTKFYDDVEFDFDDNFYISVEEYKRPKFKTEFKPITESIQLNDSVKVNGFAKAFSGANITDAKVVYHVHRKVVFPAWYYWRRPNFNSQSQEITSGETISDASGNFSITFLATPDNSVDKENLPIFTYEVTADVTDVNGETRSATTNVKVGYHAMVATISMDENIDKNNTETVVSIDTKNLNGEFIPAKGTLKIYKLKAPKNPLRERPWDAPDYQDIPENEFRKMFPNEAYFEEENNDENWKKGAIVFKQNFDTELSKKITLKNTTNWKSGKYIAILESKDKFGNTIKDQKKITLFSSKDKQVADNQLFVIKTNKNRYQPNEKVVLQIGTASKNMYVVVQIEKDYKIVETKIIRLKNEIKTIKIPIKKEDVGGFAIKYHFVNYNYFKSGSLLINVPEKETSNIEIITNVFRDKLQPGAEETWSFTIKNDKNDAVIAELLASMYDASLDEFKPHSWQFNPITAKPSYYSYESSSANKSFGVTYFNITNNSRSYYNIPNINYATYNWFGFSFQKNNWLNRQYVRNIKRKLQSTRKDFDGIITGIVEEVNGEPLPGVSVLIKGTDFKTEADFDGNYELKIKKGDVLVYSYLGYETKEILINSQTNIDVVLKEDANALDEVVVVGYGTQKKESVVGAVSKIRSDQLQGNIPGITAIQGSGIAGSNDPQIFIRGLASWKNGVVPLILVDGVITDIKDVNFNDIEILSILKGDVAEGIYGSKAAGGVVLITTKAGFKKTEESLLKVKARKNFKETAFFFPQLKTDKNGKVSFTFTMPEALTRWKLQLLAHTKNLKTASKTLNTVTQKELMVVPNAPRFLREGDKITLSAKITNLTNNQLHGFSKLILTDPISGKDLNLALNNLKSNKSFKVDKDGNTNVFWRLSIPNTVQAVQYKIVAKAGDFSDGEQSVLPVLSNRMLVTETLPMFIRSNETKTFTLEKLQNNSSSTSKNHQLTLEMTSNPVWYAIQALPYLMEYPYECAEQTFARYYANTLASFIANSNPKIQTVFNAWKSSDALLSNLEKNQELKSLIIQETPWLRDAQSETEQKKRIALLFDLNKMKNEQEKAIRKLEEMQMRSGGFPWFKGSRSANNYITLHIAKGFGHLQKIGVTEFDASTKKSITKSVKYLDNEILKQYRKLLDIAEKKKDLAKTKKKGEQAYKKFLTKNNLSYFIIQYLYMRSFYADISKDDNLKTAINYYQNQTTEYWNNYNLYAKGQIALSLFRNDQKTVANQILKSLKENSITSDELGMYWKSNEAGYYFYQAPLETHALMIEVFAEIENDEKTIDNLKIWLLKNKQTNRWKTTKATTEAVYALLLSGSDWTAITEMVAIKVGNKVVNPSEIDAVKIEAGTGYFKTSWNGEEIKPEMGTVSITKKEKGIAWGGLYWQYFEDLDKITTSKSPLQLNKKIFLKVNSDTGKELQEITKNTSLKIGDLITVRIELSTDRNMEFIHLKDMRASGVEPINVLSKYKWQDNLGYYQSTKDAATNFFFDRIPKGVYVFEYDVRVNNAGNFSNGITTIQSMYAPEFTSHSKGVRISVNK